MVTDGVLHVKRKPRGGAETSHYVAAVTSAERTAWADGAVAHTARGFAAHDQPTGPVWWTWGEQGRENGRQLGRRPKPFTDSHERVNFTDRDSFVAKKEERT